MTKFIEDFKILDGMKIESINESKCWKEKREKNGIKENKKELTKN